MLEIKATALGLVPELDQLVTLKPDGFDIVKTDDQGVSVSKFDPDSDDIAVSSERTWLVTLRASANRAQPPRTFEFGQAKIDDAKMLYQRFNDADLVAVEREAPLEQQYAGRGSRWLWWLGGAAMGLPVLAIAAYLLLRRPRTHAAGRWKLPQPLTPFTLISLLEQMQHDDGAQCPTACGGPTSDPPAGATLFRGRSEWRWPRRFEGNRRELATPASGTLAVIPLLSRQIAGAGAGEPHQAPYICVHRAGLWFPWEAAGCAITP